MTYCANIVRVHWYETVGDTEIENQVEGNKQTNKQTNTSTSIIVGIGLGITYLWGNSFKSGWWASLTNCLNAFVCAPSTDWMAFLPWFKHQWCAESENLFASVPSSVTGSVRRQVLRDEGAYLGYLEGIGVRNSGQCRFCCSLSTEVVSIRLSSESRISLPIAVDYEALTTVVQYEVIYAALILLFVYSLIIFELVHRTLAAMVGSMLALAVLSLLNQVSCHCDGMLQLVCRKAPERLLTRLLSSEANTDESNLVAGLRDIGAAVLEWWWWWPYFRKRGSLIGLLSRCVCVCLLVQCCVDKPARTPPAHVSLQAYKFAKGQTWPLITLLCFFAAVISAFLDNVTTILLMAPVSIRLCEALRLDPKLILIAEVIFSNIGGTATAIGDPPNVIIVSNSEFNRKVCTWNRPKRSCGLLLLTSVLLLQGVNFANFTLHMAVGIVFVLLGSYGLMRFLYRNVSDIQNKENFKIQGLRNMHNCAAVTQVDRCFFCDRDEARTGNMAPLGVFLCGVHARTEHCEGFAVAARGRGGCASVHAHASRRQARARQLQAEHQGPGAEGTDASRHAASHHWLVCSCFLLCSTKSRTGGCWSSVLWCSVSSSCSFFYLLSLNFFIWIWVGCANCSQQ